MEGLWACLLYSLDFLLSTTESNAYGPKLLFLFFSLFFSVIFSSYILLRKLLDFSSASHSPFSFLLGYFIFLYLPDAWESLNSATSSMARANFLFFLMISSVGS